MSSRCVRYVGALVLVTFTWACALPASEDWRRQRQDPRSRQEQPPEGLWPNKHAETAEELESPCEDSLYVALKAVPLDKMSEREYEYFTRKDEQCSDFQSHRATSGDLDEMIRKEHDNRVAFYFITAVVGVFVYAAVRASNNDER